jgi:hypothetical protein
VKSADFLVLAYGAIVIAARFGGKAVPQEFCRGFIESDLHDPLGWWRNSRILDHCGHRSANFLASNRDSASAIALAEEESHSGRSLISRLAALTRIRRNGSMTGPLEVAFKSPENSVVLSVKTMSSLCAHRGAQSSKAVSRAWASTTEISLWR